MECYDGTIHSIDSDFSETRVVASSSDAKVRVFLLEGIKLSLESELVGHDGPVTKAIFLNHGELIASSCYTGQLIIWKMEGRGYEKKFEKKVFNGSINTLSHKWDKSSFTVYCGCSDGRVRALSFDTGFNLTEDEIYCHRYGVSCMSNNSECLITGGMDFSVALWPIFKPKEIHRFQDHTSFVRDVSVCPSNGFKLLCFASCSDDGNVIIYTQDGPGFKKQIISIGEPCYSLSWSKAGFSLCVGYGSSCFKSYSPDSSGEFVEVEITKLED
jgi:protein transport protein SEC13